MNKAITVWSIPLINQSQATTVFILMVMLMEYTPSANEDQ